MNLLFEKEFHAGKIKVVSHVFGPRTIYYHGTNLSIWKKIKDDPNGALIGKATQFGASKRKVVYLTTDFSAALGYAKHSRQNNKTPVILSVKAENIDLNHLFRDDNHYNHPYYEYTLPILKKFITLEKIL